MSIEILHAGMLSTVQDFGRFGVMKNGFSQNGAMDTYSMKIANRLVGNDLDCAVLEMTMMGITARFTDQYWICISGADMSCKLNDAAIRTNKAYAVKSGDILTCAYAKNGVRSYLAVSGGIAVEKVMGSCSTDLKSAIGGFSGRKLQKGDILEVGSRQMEIPSDALENRQIEPNVYTETITVRAIPGPQDDMFSEQEVAKFFSQVWTVTNQTDRMGIRLEGEAITSKNGVDIISDGIVFGSIQIPKNGKPIILMADHQTTGGYAKIATVISTDLPLLAQARPNTTIHFAKISVRKAQKLVKKEKKFFDQLLLFR